MEKKNYGIIVAAGKGKRMGGDINKVYLPLEDKPIIVHTLESFCQVSLIDGVIVVVSKDEVDYFKREVMSKYSFSKPIVLVLGGKERQFSVYNGLMELPDDTGVVAIHDGARPFINPEIIEESISSAQKYGAAVAGVPVKDTIKEVNSDSWVSATLKRDFLWAVQTPQAFLYPLIMQAHEQAREEGVVMTDDSGLVERLGKPVKMIYGGYDNIKITTWEDLLVAGEILRARSKELKEG